MDWLDLLAVQGTLKSLLQHHNSKASILWHSDFFIVQLSHPYMTTGKTIALTRWPFVGKVMSLVFNMLSRLVVTFLSRSKGLLISWLEVALRWQRNRTGRPPSPPQIRQKIIWTLSKYNKTTSEHWQRTPGTQKGSPLSSKGGRTKYKREKQRQKS